MRDISGRGILPDTPLPEMLFRGQFRFLGDKTITASPFTFSRSCPDSRSHVHVVAYLLRFRCTTPSLFAGHDNDQAYTSYIICSALSGYLECSQESTTSLHEWLLSSTVGPVYGLRGIYDTNIPLRMTFGVVY